MQILTLTFASNEQNLLCKKRLIVASNGMVSDDLLEADTHSRAQAALQREAEVRRTSISDQSRPVELQPTKGSISISDFFPQ